MMYRLSEIVDELNCLMKELVSKMDHQQAVYRVSSIAIDRYPFLKNSDLIEYDYGNVWTLKLKVNPEEYERFEDFDEAF